jgi:hypothetical protein
MIIVNLSGGLGNQMFQYAFGRSLSLRLNKEVKFATDMFDLYKNHNGLELTKVFKINVEIATNQNFRKLCSSFYSSPYTRRVLNKLKFQALSPSNFVFEHQDDFKNRKFNKINLNSYFHGYWQSESYFKDFSKVLLSDFTFNQDFSGKNLEVARLIMSHESVSIHIRRGDYIKNKKAFNLLGICDLDYYHRAVNAILKKKSNLFFFIFSDDPQWVKSNFMPLFPNSYIVEGNLGNTSYVDMQLMSICDHNIIANSTFSWWAAWLNKNHRKIIVAPKKWYSNKSAPEDLIPSSWLKI